MYDELPVQMVQVKSTYFKNGGDSTVLKNYSFCKNFLIYMYAYAYELNSIAS